MGRLVDFSGGYRWVLLFAAVASAAIYVACNSVAVPEAVVGPDVIGNRAPALTITEPVENLSIGQGTSFAISWVDQDRDSAALISFSLVNTNPESSPAAISLVEGIPENDAAAADTITVSTGFVPRGSYYLQGTIDDDVNEAVTVFSTTEEPASTRVVITIGEEGTTPGNRPPTIYVTEPSVNLAVTLDDTIVIRVQPTEATPNASIPYDPDSTPQLYISLDLDADPLTGDPLNPDPEEIIPLLSTPITIGEGAWEPLDDILISVDLDRFPLREDGKPYYIRATIDDDVNPPRDVYAKATINVTRAATGLVDLDKVGGTLTGARWLGFDPGARLGTAMTGGFNFDGPTGDEGEDDIVDVVDDCILVAQFGAPTGLGAIGEAYLIYGLSGLRFGGRINVNAVGTDVGGATFMGPKPRTPGSEETDGIAAVGYVTDLSGDNRPELLFGCSYVDGVRQHRDDDPGDTQPGGADTFEAEIRQGQITIMDTRTEEVTEQFLTYEGVSDTYLDANDPNTAFGDEDWFMVNAYTIDDDVVPRTWALIKFEDLFGFVSDFALWDVPDLPEKTLNSAVLEFEGTFPGGNAPTLYPLLRNFNETATYANWPWSGGDPEEDIDYESDSLDFDEDTIAAFNKNTVDVSATFEDWLAGRTSILGWIIVPADEDRNNFVAFVSSDYESNPDQRPILRINYSVAVEEELADLDGCYPDNLPNNTSNSPDEQGSEDDVIATRGNLERLGMVALIHSENRDASGWQTVARLDRATVSIDLAGQRPVDDQELPHAVPEKGAIGASGRLEGARFQAAMYDVIDAKNLDQGPIRAKFGSRVGFLPDIGNDQRPEIIVSAPRNELDIEETKARYPTLRESEIPHLRSRRELSNIVVFHGENFNELREKTPGCSTIPYISLTPPVGSCSTDPKEPRGLEAAAYQTLEIKGEKPSDMLGDGSSAGDFNLDGSPDILCGAAFADGPTGENVGATYIVYQRQQNVQVDIDLADADATSSRPPMLRIRGDKPEDRIGWAQESVFDINGDRIDDIVLASPYADAGGVPSGECSRDFNGNGTQADSEDNAVFSACRAEFGEADLPSDNDCAFFDYNNDRRVDELDAEVFAGGDCPVDNGVIAVVFGGIMLDGDRVVEQIATSDLPGVVFYGANAGDRAGYDVASSGDFNRDLYGDLLISAPGATAVDDDGRTRVGVVYLIFGGPHLNNRRFSLSDIGTADLPGIVFLSPYEAGAPDEAPPQFVAGLGDLNNDGFDDIGIGNPLADFVDDLLPQMPGSPGSDLTTGRRRDAGEIYMIYGHSIPESNP